MSVDHRHIINLLNSDSSNSREAQQKERRVLTGSIRVTSSLSKLLQWEMDTPAVYSCDPVTQQEVLGLGACQTIEARDADMFARIKECLLDPNLSPHLKWYGMFAFDPTTPQSGVWNDMPQAVWFIPKLRLTRENASTIQIVYVDDEGFDIADVEASVRAWMVECEQVAQIAGIEPQADSAQSATHLPTDVIHDESTWDKMIDAALSQIRAHDLHKVVLARQASQRVETSVAVAIERLSHTYSQSHVFACHWARRWLIGASPEQLVRATDGVIEVDCLAGSTGRGDTANEDDRLAGYLLRSVKDRAEHHAVVQFVTDKLKWVADDIAFKDSPSVKQLANVQHLHTPVSGRLQAGRTIVDTLELLHPTPAVGGVPRAEALAFIRAHEHWNRGFYAGGFGFVDGRGNGLFSVALRCAAIAYPEARLYAGCGIVDGSVAQDEWQETEMKLQPMRMALT